MSGSASVGIAARHASVPLLGAAKRETGETAREQRALPGHRRESASTHPLAAPVCRMQPCPATLAPPRCQAVAQSPREPPQAECTLQLHSLCSLQQLPTRQAAPAPSGSLSALRPGTSTHSASPLRSRAPGAGAGWGKSEDKKRRTGLYTRTAAKRQRAACRRASSSLSSSRVKAVDAAACCAACSSNAAGRANTDSRAHCSKRDKHASACTAIRWLVLSSPCVCARLASRGGETQDRGRERRERTCARASGATSEGGKCCAKKLWYASRLAAVPSTTCTCRPGSVAPAGRGL